MKKILITALVFLAFITPIALAGEYDDWESWERTCIGDALIMNKTVGIVPNLKLAEQNMTCSFGCNNQTQTCIPGYPKSEESIMIITGILAIAAILLYLGIKLKDNHWVMQYFFMFIALFLILTGIYLIFNLYNLSWTQISDIMLTSYTAVLYTVILFLFYFILQIIINAVRHLSGGKKE